MKRTHGTRFFTAAEITNEARLALERAGFSRRDFLKGTGALVVGFSVAGRLDKLGASNAAIAATLDVPLNQVDSWIAIAQDESVTGYTGKCEFGQGFRTVQYQLIADELYVPLERITLVVCDTAVTPDQGTTSGSQSHPRRSFSAGDLRPADRRGAVQPDGECGRGAQGSKPVHGARYLGPALRNSGQNDGTISIRPARPAARHVAWQGGPATRRRSHGDRR